MKKCLMLFSLVTVLSGSLIGCQNSDEAINQEGEVNEAVVTDLKVEIENEFEKFKETATYARSSEVEKDELVKKLEQHHKAFRNLEKRNAEQHPNTSVSDMPHQLFLTSIVGRLDGLISFIVNNGIEEDGPLSLQYQFSEETIKVHENILNKY
jgi:hypothetical protein